MSDKLDLDAIEQARQNAEEDTGDAVRFVHDEAKVLIAEVRRLRALAQSARMYRMSVIFATKLGIRPTDSERYYGSELDDALAMEEK